MKTSNYHTDLHQTLISYVRGNNKFFPQKRNLKKFESIVHTITENGTREDLTMLMTIFIYGNEAQKTIIEKICLPWLRRLPCSEIPKLDEELRKSISYSSYLMGNQCYFDNEPGIFELFVLSCHPSGYTRERALVALAKYPEPATLSLALIRCNDWVTQIRLSARDLTMGIIAKIEIHDLVKVWNVFDRISLGQRHHDISLTKTLFPILRKRVPQKLLHRQLKADNSRTRRYAADIMWQTHQSLNFADLQALCSCSDPYICFRTLRDILPRFNTQIQEPLLDLVKKKKWAPARLERLRILMNNDSEKIRCELIDALCDRSESIRNFARFHLKNDASVDLAAHYQSSLKSDNISHRIAALSGLHEIGSPTALEYAEQWLHEANPRIIAVALSILTPKIINQYEEYILNQLTSIHPQVSKAAYSALCKNPPLPKRILSVFHQKNLSQRCYINCANLLLRQNRWVSVAYAIRFCRHDREEIRSYAESWLKKWIYGQRTCWTLPSATERQDIHQELNQSTGVMSENLSTEILFFLKDYD